MGIDYVYANHTKKQYFDVGLFGGSGRLRNAGFGFGSRALSLLISERGCWNSDSIEMVNDATDKSIFISSEYTNISVEAELLILDIDGVEHFKGEGELDFTTFTNLCLYAMILRRPDVLDLMDKKYGPGVWQKQYNDHYRGHSPTMAHAIYEAQARSLVLYGIGIKKRYDMRCSKHNEQGHIDMGFTLAIWIILGGVAWLVYKSKGEPLAMWLGWPWWAKVISIAGPIVILLGGSIFENARKWPKV